MNGNSMLIPPQTRQRQQRAIDPERSAWVSANAGSGKTFVLVRRVIRLLLTGAPPSTLMCLTFTKAAAAQMKDKVFELLAEWTVIDDSDLDAALMDIGLPSPGPSTRARARQLFAACLETPGGLKIQTIHAFCEGLLQKFPLEANIPGQFSVLANEMEQRDLIARELDSLMAEAAHDPSGKLSAALDVLMKRFSDLGVQQLLYDAALNRHQLAAQRGVSLGALAADADQRLMALFDLRTDDSLSAVEAAIPQSPLFSGPSCADLLGRLAQSGFARNTELLRRFNLALDHNASCDQWLAVFFTESSGAYQPRKFAAWTTKDIWTSLPELPDRFDAEIDRLDGLLEKRAALETQAVTTAFLTWADALIERYERVKQRLSKLDYQDLIERTVTLLSGAPAAAWVLYKLDRGVDHILVDEAQDTSPDQWQIIENLTREFFAGRAADDSRTRTVFAVGDEKQSIYSFQGADPRKFDEMRRHFDASVGSADQQWSSIQLALSFRSAPEVIQAVDTVFAGPSNRRGLTADNAAPVHETIRGDAAGRIEIWPRLSSDKPLEPENWYEPLDHLQEQDPMVQLANRIADQIATWLAKGTCLPTGRSPIRPGDILILVRRRKTLTRTLNRALKRRGIDVAGEDRLVLSDHIVFKDIVSMIRFILMPADDLSLAEFLKSPPVALSEEQLAEVAISRPGTLWQALQQTAATAIWAQRAVALLSDLMSRADDQSPFDLLIERLSAGGWRQAYRRRLGQEVDEILDEILEQALAFEQSEPASFQGFLKWLDGVGGDIKREVDDTKNEVQVMTVHGAKGLEAPIVFVVDDGSNPTSASHDPAWLTGPAADPYLMLKMPKMMATKQQKSLIDAVREEALEEYHRLLYVAMTRAKDWLFVCGYFRSREPNGSWHQMVSDALVPDARTDVGDDDSITRWVWPLSAADGGTGTADRTDGNAGQLDPPDWLGQSHPTALDAVTSVTPSRLKSEDVPSVGDATPVNRARARQQGTAVHRLLQSLPAVDRTQREEIAKGYLARAYPDWGQTSQNQVARQALAILHHPDFTDLFGPNALAELPVAGRFEIAGKTISIAGQIDRLVVLPDRVIIADFKTIQTLPGSVAQIPVSHRRQIAAYHKLIAPLYPERSTAGLLIYADSDAGVAGFALEANSLLHEDITAL